MSVKSLLQIILFLLIILIIGSIYYVYFLKIPLNNKVNINTEIQLNKKEIMENEVLSKEERLDEIQLIENEKFKVRKNNNIDQVNLSVNNNNLLENSSEKNDLKLNESSTNEIKNLTKKIEYISTNKNGDTFKILAKYGKTNLRNSNILDLEDVKGTVILSEGSIINISSDYAKYNYNDQQSEFINNIQLNYDDKLITCDNLSIKITKNIAIAYNNVVIKDKKSMIKADNVQINLITKDINLNSENIIQLIKN
tara:strand:- start:498 stop:1256 length:759 start_codon:yes stop_codon:yes gene_type:complete